LPTTRQEYTYPKDPEPRSLMGVYLRRTCGENMGTASPAENEEEEYACDAETAAVVVAAAATERNGDDLNTLGEARFDASR
jgi:hypothetical protein